MLNRTAEESFEKGLLALKKGDWREATAFLEAALKLERRLNQDSPQARYRSYFGLCIGLAKKRHHDAIKMCRSAIGMERYNADLHWNLGRVLLDAGRKREAYTAFVRGLRQEPGHKGLVAELRRMGVRQRPVLPFLKRTHPLNVMFGRMRAQARTKAKTKGRAAAKRVVRRAR